jgi:hypothetical protein
VICTRNIVAQNPPDRGRIAPTATPGHVVVNSSVTSSVEIVTVFTVAVFDGTVEPCHR